MSDEEQPPLYEVEELPVERRLSPRDRRRKEKDVRRDRRSLRDRRAANETEEPKAR